MTPRQLRLMRSAGVSGVATILAAVSHTFGGGAAPHPLLVLALATLLTPVAAVLIGSGPSRARVATAVLVSQAAFHAAFQALGSPTGIGAGTGAPRGHLHTLDLSALGTAASAAGVDGTMVVAHVIAGVLTVLLVWHGETVLRAIAAWVRALLRSAPETAPAQHRRPPRLRSSRRPRHDVAVTAAVSRRGPPVLLHG